MQCPKCDHNCSIEVEGMQCRHCGYEFKIDPQLLPEFTDLKFLNLVKAVSENETVAFTPNQLYSAYVAISGKPINLMMIAFIGFIAVIAVVGFFITWLITAGAIVFALLVVASMSESYLPDRRKLQQAIDMWGMQREPLNLMVVEPRMGHPQGESSDAVVHDFGVDRILIVEHDYLVDMFMRNDYHTSARTLVLSESGYPRYLLPVAVKLLNDRWGVPIILLHDATPRGRLMLDRFRQSDLLPINDHPVVNLGLFKDDLATLGRFRAIVKGLGDQAVPLDIVPYNVLAEAIPMALDMNISLAEAIGRLPNSMLEVVGEFTG